MGANSGEPWSEMDIRAALTKLPHGRTATETRASFVGTMMVPRKARPAWIGRAPRIWLKVVR